MGIFKSSNGNDDAAKSYKGMSKEQLIETILSQKSQNEFLQTKLSEATSALTQAKASQAQSSQANPGQLAALQEENEALRRQLGEMNSEFEKVGVIADRNEELTKRNEELTRRNEQLTKRNDELTMDNEELTSRLAAKGVQKQEPKEPTNPGSIAEMSFQVNGVMTAAQKAADEYLAKIQAMHDEMSLEHSRYENEAKRKADNIIRSANEEADSILTGAKRESNEIWQSLSSVIRKYCGDKEYKF